MNSSPLPFPPAGPDEALLMSYLYGELPAETHRAVAAYLAQHPERKADLAGLQAVRDWLQHHPTPAPPAPPLLLMPAAPAPRRRAYAWLRAAAVLLALVMGAGLADLRISWHERTLHIGYGTYSPPVTATSSPPALTPETLQLALDTQRDSLHQAIARLENRLRSRPQPAPTRQDPAQLQALRDELLAENTRRMAELLSVSQAYQQEATEDLLRQFSFFLQQQRAQDLELISYALDDIVRTSGRQQQETTWLLTELLAQLQAP